MAMAAGETAAEVVNMKEEHRHEMAVEIGVVETPIMAVETPIMAAGENEMRLVSWYMRWGRKLPTPV